MRSTEIKRITTETEIIGKLSIDGVGKYQIETGIGFLDHMVSLIAKHGGFDLEISAKGDLHVDQHHTIEDVGIVLGELFHKALGDRIGINRAGYFVQTMDESLAVVALDLGGRSACVYDGQIVAERIGDLVTEDLPEFFEGFARATRANVHVKVMYGRSSHHKAEAIFKAFGRALRFACATDERLKDQLPSTKGLL